jgi:hypothetical protein
MVLKAAARQGPSGGKVHILPCGYFCNKDPFPPFFTLVTARPEVDHRLGETAPRMAFGILAQTATHQVAVLSYAGCFIIMAAIGCGAMCLIPVFSPFSPAPKQPHSNRLADLGSRL